MARSLYVIPGDGNCMFNAVLLAASNIITAHPSEEISSIGNQLDLRLKIRESYLSDQGGNASYIKEAIKDSIKTGLLSGYSSLMPIMGEIRARYLAMQSTDKVGAEQYLNDSVGSSYTNEIGDESNLVADYFRLIGVAENAIWGSGLELQLLSKLLDVKIQIEGYQYPIDSDSSSGAPTITIQYTGGNHYNAYAENPDETILATTGANALEESRDRAAAMGGAGGFETSAHKAEPVMKLLRLPLDKFYMALNIIYANKAQDLSGADIVLPNSAITDIEIENAIKKMVALGVIQRQDQITEGLGRGVSESSTGADIIEGIKTDLRSSDGEYIPSAPAINPAISGISDEELPAINPASIGISGEEFPAINPSTIGMDEEEFPVIDTTGLEREVKDLQRKKDIRGAINSLKKALPHFQGSKGSFPDTPPMLNIFECIGLLLQREAKFDEAKQYLIRALNMARRMHDIGITMHSDSNDIRLAEVLWELGDTYKMSADYNKAIKCYVEVIEMRKTLVSGAFDEKIISLLLLKAGMLAEMGHMQEAINCYQDPYINEMRKLRHISDDQAANIYLKIGDLLYQDDKDNARKHYLLSLQLLKNRYKKGAPEMAEIEKRNDRYRVIGEPALPTPVFASVIPVLAPAVPVAAAAQAFAQALEARAPRATITSSLLAESQEIKPYTPKDITSFTERVRPSASAAVSRTPASASVAPTTAPNIDATLAFIEGTTESSARGGSSNRRGGSRRGRGASREGGSRGGK